MKKSLILIFVLGMTSLTSATVLDVVANGLGFMGHAGTSTDPLEPGEKLHLKLVLNWAPGSFPGGGYPSYDGYLLSGMDLNLHASSGSTLGVEQVKGPSDNYRSHEDWSFKGTPSITSNVMDTGPWASNADNIGTTNGILAGGSNQDILWNFFITVDGTEGLVNLTWSLNDPPGQYADYTGDGIVPDPTWKDITLSDLGGLTVYVVPEPATIALLGVGGLLLLRRKK